MCGEQDAKTVYFYIDRCLDPAGSSDDVLENFDICGKCSLGVLGWYASKNNFETNSAIVTKIQNQLFDFRKNKPQVYNSKL